MKPARGPHTVFLYNLYCAIFAMLCYAIFAMQSLLCNLGYAISAMPSLLCNLVKQSNGASSGGQRGARR